MTIIGIIPSRYQSSRFPGKPLVMISGKSMIQRVYEQATKCKSLDRVVVATDDERIFNHVKEFGGDVVMTSSQHQSGTDRCAEAVSLVEGNYDAVINIQGDEPFIQPEQIELVADCLKEGADIATLVKRIEKWEDTLNTSIVKASLDLRTYEAIDFNRKMVFADAITTNVKLLDAIKIYKHIGIYGYKTSILQTISKLPPSHLEKLHSLEQLRWLENGFKIKVKETAFETVAVDTPEDLGRVGKMR